MKKYIPDKIYIDDKALNKPLTDNILSLFDGIQYEIVTWNENKNSLKDHISITQNKRILKIKQNPGRFIERCPGTREHLCCNYFVANIAVNCHFECTYCFLQSYLNDHSMTVYTNTDKLFDEVDELLSMNQDQVIRIGTGELADSLALDEITGFSKYLVPGFAERKNVLLELKTKGNYVKNLLETDPKGNTVIAWSLNPPEIIKLEELKCASLEERLSAARICSEAGYKIAFHFDPIILHHDWEDNYRQTIEMMFDFVKPDMVQWISMGVLRFTPAGKEIIRERFPKSPIIYEEMIRCADGKMRYLQPVRTEIYTKLLDYIRTYSRELYVYLCMESSSVWEKVFGSNYIVQNPLDQF